MKITNENELYTLLPEEFRDEYTLGFHGFDSGLCWKKTEDGHGYELNEEYIQGLKESILANGLKFPKNRLLLSTVRFSDLGSYISTEGYFDAGGIIVALPKKLRSTSGETMFLGWPDEETMDGSVEWDRNHDATSLGEVILPEDGKLDPIFVLGSYSKDKEGINFEANPNHIVFNKGIVSDEYFKVKKEKVFEIKDSLDPLIFLKVKNQKNQYDKSQGTYTLGEDYTERG